MIGGVQTGGVGVPWADLPNAGCGGQGRVRPRPGLRSSCVGSGERNGAAIGCWTHSDGIPNRVLSNTSWAEAGHPC